MEEKEGEERMRNKLAFGSEGFERIARARAGGLWRRVAGGKKEKRRGERGEKEGEERMRNKLAFGSEGIKFRARARGQG